MNRYIKPLGLGIVVALACSSAVVARAQTSNWNVGNGNWSVPGNWSPSGVPGAGDTVNIVDSDGVSRTITYDFIHIGPALTLGGADSRPDELYRREHCHVVDVGQLIGGWWQ